MNTKETETVPAQFSSMEELRAYNDERFIYLAYHAILGRDPEPEAINYYLSGALRADNSYQNFLVTLRNSEEAKVRWQMIADAQYHTLMPALTHTVNSLSEDLSALTPTARQFYLKLKSALDSRMQGAQ